MSGKKLLDRVRDTLRRKNYAFRTEQAYTSWIKRYIFYHHKRHPEEMGEHETEAFLTYLAVESEVSPSTQNQALAALQFLYNEVLHLPLDQEILPAPAKRPKHLPVVLSKREALGVFEELSGVHKLIARLLYGSGLRVSECLRLRIQDLDFDRGEILIRSGKGSKDRVSVLPDAVRSDLQRHLKSVKVAHQQALAEGYGSVGLHRGLSRKYPNAAREWIWQYVFPAPKRSRDPRSGEVRRPSSPPQRHSPGSQSCCPQGGCDKTRHTPYFQAQFRHPLAGKRL